MGTLTTTATQLDVNDAAKLSGGSVIDNLILTEDGDMILTEDGDPLMVE